MYKHKSFVLKGEEKAEVKAISKPPAKHMTPITPKKEVRETVVAHYDNNEPISLSLPQSLSFTYELSCDHDTNFHKASPNTSRGQSLSYRTAEDDFSEANAYFRAEDENRFERYTNSRDERDRFTRATSEETVASAETKKLEESGLETMPSTTPEEITKNKEVAENSSEQDTATLEEINQNTEKLAGEDKKFEEDLKAIMEGKKAFDKERIKKDPTTVLKDKNHGVMDKKDEEGKKIEEKMKNEHAIFDKIAQSMEMANSYDLGSIAMDKKFDDLEQLTNKDFNLKIHTLLEDKKKDKEGVDSNDKIEIPTNDEVKDKVDLSNKQLDTKIDESKKEIIDQAETQDEDAIINNDKESPVEVNKDQDSKEDDKILTKDFLKDLDELSEIEKKSQAKKAFVQQASFNSTISIKHRYLKSRIFTVTGGRCEVMINSHWNPPGCSTLPELNVTLSEHKTLLPDTDHGTNRFRIGGPDTHVWSNLPQGDYYLTFYFANNTNPHCELTGTIDVRT